MKSSRLLAYPSCSCTWGQPGRRAGGLLGHRSQVEGGLEEDVEQLELFFRKKRIMPGAFSLEWYRSVSYFLG